MSLSAQMKTADSKTPKIRVGLRLTPSLWLKTCAHAAKWGLTKNAVMEKSLEEFHAVERVALMKK